MRRRGQAPVSAGALARRLGTGDAVVVGLSAMLGAGVFAVFGPAAAAAGSGLIAGLGIAAVVAFCNAVASAQLAAAHPASGGTYLFGRVVLGPWWGFVAGWGFVIGKTASCAAMAMTFAAYALPGSAGAGRAAGAAAVIVLTLLALRGVTRTARAARVLLVVVLAVLAGFLVLAWAGGAADGPAQPLPAVGGVAGVLQSAGLIFFAFAGYARIATLAEEVVRPQMIGRAILIAFAVAVTLYAALAVTLVAVLGASLPTAETPIAAAVAALGVAWADPVVRVGAAAASLGALLALLTGVSRTLLAMARERDLPSGLAHVGATHRVPDRAQVVVGAAVVALVLAADLRGAIGFSAFGVLTYYFVANAAAFRQPAAQRTWPRALNVLGMTGCAALALTLPAGSVVKGLLVLLVGVLGRALVVHRRRARADTAPPIR